MLIIEEIKTDWIAWSNSQHLKNRNTKCAQKTIRTKIAVIDDIRET